MKSKYIILALLTLFIMQPAFSQTLTDSSVGSKKMGKVSLKADKIVQDSALDTHPLLYADVIDIKTKTADVEDNVGKYKIKFYPDSKRGVIDIKFDKLPKETIPDIEFCNSRGNVIKRAKANKIKSIINLRKVPNGTYIFIADINEERFSWEIVKE